MLFIPFDVEFIMKNNISFFRDEDKHYICVKMTDKAFDDTGILAKYINGKLVKKSIISNSPKLIKHGSKLYIYHKYQDHKFYNLDDIDEKISINYPIVFFKYPQLVKKVKFLIQHDHTSGHSIMIKYFDVRFNGKNKIIDYVVKYDYFNLGIPDFNWFKPGKVHKYGYFSVNYFCDKCFYVELGKEIYSYYGFFTSYKSTTIELFKTLADQPPESLHFIRLPIIAKQVVTIPDGFLVLGDVATIIHLDENLKIKSMRDWSYYGPGLKFDVSPDTMTYDLLFTNGILRIDIT